MVINVQMEDKYKITISVDGVHVLVENLSVPDSCVLNVYKFEDNEEGTVIKAYDKKNWEEFICGLIDLGHLD